MKACADSLASRPDRRRSAASTGGVSPRSSRRSIRVRCERRPSADPPRLQRQPLRRDRVDPRDDGAPQRLGRRARVRAVLRWAARRRSSRRRARRFIGWATCRCGSRTPRLAHDGRSREVISGRSFDRVVCHAPWSQALFGGVVRRAGRPLVFWAHDVMTGRHWTERLARRVPPDLAICNSHFTRRSLAALYPAVRSAVVYAPVEMPAVVSGGDRLRVRAVLDTPADSVVIVQACRSEEWKGHEALLDALVALRGVPGWIVVAGRRRAASARARVPRPGCATRPLVKASAIGSAGSASDPMSVSCSPRRTSTASPTSIRSRSGSRSSRRLARSSPVVTTRQGAAEELLDAACGVLVSPGQAIELQAALRELVDRFRAAPRLASHARARARQLCDPGAQFNRLRVGVDRDDPSVRAGMTISGAAAYQHSKHARDRASEPAATRSTGWSPPRSIGTTSRGAASSTWAADKARCTLPCSTVSRIPRPRCRPLQQIPRDAGEFTRVDLDAASLAGAHRGSGRSGRRRRNDRASRKSVGVRPAAGGARLAGRLGCGDHAEPVERAQPDDPDREAALFGVSGRALSGSSHGPARERSVPHGGRERVSKSSRSATPAVAAFRWPPAHYPAAMSRQMAARVVGQPDDRRAESRVTDGRTRVLFVNSGILGHRTVGALFREVAAMSAANRRSTSTSAAN